MQDLIKISTDPGSGQPLVSARELYAFLEIGENMTDWIARMLGYGFTKGVDYQAVSVFVSHSNGIGGTNKKDYALTIDCAKEISMLQRSEKGKQARQYFIECERRAKLPAMPSRKELALMVVAAEEENEKLQKQIETDAPKVLFANTLSGSIESVMMKELSCYLTQNGVKDMGRNNLFEYLREHGYLIKSGEEKNMPTQSSLKMGLFTVKRDPFTKPNGVKSSGAVTKVTPKGLEYFLKIFLTKSAA